MRGALFTLGQLILQVALTFCISMYVALRTEHEWAKRTSLIGMLTIQGAMAAWALIADPADRLEGVITCLVSLIEASATSILLAAACLRDTALSQQTSTLKTMGSVSAGLLIGAVFAPIGLSVYDNVLLPTANAYQMRKECGQSTCRAVLGIVVQNVTLPVVIIANIFGWSFKVVDVLEAAAGEANTTASDGSVARRSVTAGNTGSSSTQKGDSGHEETTAGNFASLTDKTRLTQVLPCTSCLASSPAKARTEEHRNPQSVVKRSSSNSSLPLTHVVVVRFFGRRSQSMRFLNLSVNGRTSREQRNAAEVGKRAVVKSEEASVTAQMSQSKCRQIRMDRELGATEFAAVLKLQNAWRQQQGRRQLQQRRFELAKASAMTSAATRVQAVLRKWHTSNVIQLKSARKMQESCRAHIRNRQLDAAVVKIQAGWRGYAVRRSTKSPNGKTFVQFFDVIPAWD